MLIITAAWPGARWGELGGLQRFNLDLDAGELIIGALHEVNGHFELGPPESARTISLPPFLIALLRAHLKSHSHPHVFITAEGELLQLLTNEMTLLAVEFATERVLTTLRQAARVGRTAAVVRSRSPGWSGPREGGSQ